MSTLTPEDRLWVAILLRDEETQSLEPSEVRAVLQERGFPQEVVEDYLLTRG